MDGQKADGSRTTFSKVMDFALPAASFAASTYGPTYTAATRTGLDALSKVSEGRRRHRLGKDVVRLAEAMADRDVSSQKELWDKNKPEAAAKTEGEKITEEGGADMAFATVPMRGDKPGEAPEQAADKKMRERETGRLAAYMESMPEPVRDETYLQIGALAMNDPDKALSMLMDRDNFNQTLRLKEMDHYRQQLRDRLDREFKEDEAEKGRRFQQIENLANRASQEKSQDLMIQARQDLQNESLAMQKQMAEIAAASRIDVAELYAASRQAVGELKIATEDREDATLAMSYLHAWDAKDPMELTADQQQKLEWARQTMTRIAGDKIEVVEPGGEGGGEPVDDEPRGTPLLDKARRDKWEREHPNWEDTLHNPELREEHSDEVAERRKRSQARRLAKSGN